MSVPNYEYFVRIVETGSLTKAAEKLYISQPSLSQYLKRLENSLGVELFDRGTLPLRLSFAGERYYQYALQMMKLEENMRRELQDIKNQESGLLRLGVALWRGACLLPDVFPYFHEHYPGIRVELMEGRTSQLVSALTNDKIDIAIMNLPALMNYSTLTCETIFEEPILLAAPTGHPCVQQALANGTYRYSYPTATLDLVKEIPLILTKPGQNLTVAVSHALGKYRIESNILLETGNLTTAINLVATGAACTFVPGEGAKVCIHPGRVTYFLVELPELIWPLAAVFRKDVYLSRISRLFIDTLKILLKIKFE